MGPFVAREAELATVRSAFASAVAGRPRVVLVEGEAGFGKSSLLNRFCGEAKGARVLRAAGEESERLLAYGVAAQLMGDGLPEGHRDPLSVGADLLAAIDRAQGREGVVLVVVDDLHWADQQSAAALLFGLRRLVADRVLALISARPGELGSTGEGWSRFVSGDPRASRIALGGLNGADVKALAELLGTGPVPLAAASRLVEHTSGSPLWCRALLEELGPDGLLRGDGALPAPKAFGSVILARVRGLSGAAERLVTASAVLGERCLLRSAAELAGLDDPIGALEEAIAAGLVGEQGIGAGAEVSFAHPLTRAAVYGDLGPAQRRRLHSRAAGLLAPVGALPHRVAAAVGADGALSQDLEAAATRARREGQPGRAAAWLEQTASVCGPGSERERLLLEALDVLVGAADVGAAIALVGRLADIPESALRGALVAELDLLAGRSAGLEARLSELWDAHDPLRERAAGARIATTLAFYLLFSARVEESIVWAERALEAGSGDPTVELICRPLIALCDVWLRGGQAVRGLDDLPSDPAAVPLQSTDALWIRGNARMSCDELLGAVGDLRTVFARVRAGVPVRYPTWCLAWLADAEYRLGRWDDAVVHGELAVSLSHHADRVLDYAFVHAYAAYVPAARGQWEVAGAHVQAARSSAETLGVARAVVAAATARAALADARGDPAAVLDAAAWVRRTGRPELMRPGLWDWQHFELEALINLDRYEDADRALAELEFAADRFDLASARVSAAGLRGRLAAAVGDRGGADVAFEKAWQLAAGLPTPYRVAWLGVADGRRLRQAGRRRDAIERLQAARVLLAGLGARPYLQRCDDELTACGMHSVGDTGDPAAGLTQSELAVARLVASGHSNRETASELFISVKTVEFHLRHVYQKLGIRSRVVLAQRIRGREQQD